MARKKIPARGPFRYIRKSDVKKPFDNRFKRLNGVDFSSLLKDNKGSIHVLVYEYQRNILCFLALEDKGTHFYLNLIENNELFQTKIQTINPAPKLITYVEIISPHYGYKKVTLNSIQPLIQYYRDLGYSETGRTSYRQPYGLLTEMEKIL